MTKSFKLQIELENDAMATPADVVDALRGVADSIERKPGAQGNIRDINGNLVGGWRFMKGKK